MKLAAQSSRSSEHVHIAQGFPDVAFTGPTGREQHQGVGPHFDHLTILYAAQEAVRDNDIDHALNYRTITKAIIAHVEGNRFALLERLTQEILDLVMANASVLYAEVEVDKPHALRFAESVSITLAASR